MLSLYKLEIFATVVRAGSFSAAADRLYMTQPAVSQHIQDLERSLGVRLFDRGRRGVTLTPPGERLLAYTENILVLVAEAERAVTDVRNLESGAVHLGVTPGVSVYLLPEWVRDFQQAYENLTLQPKTDVTAAIVADVLEERLDLGIVEGEVHNMQTAALGMVILRDIQAYVVVGQSHPLCWEKDAIPIERLGDLPYIDRQPGSQTHEWVMQLFATHNTQPQVVAQFDNPESIKQAIAAGLGVSILPDYAVKREIESGLLHSLPLEGVTLLRRLKLVWNKNAILSPIASAFVEYLQQEFPALESAVNLVVELK